MVYRWQLLYHIRRKKGSWIAVVSDTEIIESLPLPSGTSSQKAELIALTRALTLAGNKRATYTLILNMLSTSYTHMLPSGRNKGSYLLKALS